MQIIGHRGAKGLAPENSITGIKLAIARGVDWIEFDVRATKDGELVILHDRTLFRVAKRHHRVEDLTYRELKQIATVSGESIPTFAEAMKAIGTQAKIDIELKSDRTAKKVVAEIKRQVATGRPYNDFVVSSFRPWLLREVQRHDANVPLLLLQGAMPFFFLFLPGIKLSAVGFSKIIAPRFAISLAKKRGLWTVVHTINSKTEAKFFAARGIDALVTDVPHAFKPLWPRLLLWLSVLLGAVALACLLIRYLL